MAAGQVLLEVQVVVVAQVVEDQQEEVGRPVVG